MKSKLCIMLQSMYTLNTKEQSKDYERWSLEVETDSETVAATLSDHDILRIIVPVRAKPGAITALIDQSIAQYIKKEYDSCHIVLNTHGAAGASDLTDEAVKQTLRNVSSLGIAVSQLSALQCNGMSALSSEEQREADPMKPAHSTARGKNSSMSILQQKLNHMSTARPQTFAIYGFSSAYDPSADRELVNQVLRGESTPSLNVTTTTPQSRQAYLQQIIHSLEIIKETKAAERIGNSRYDAAGNVLGTVLEQMKKNLFASLRSGTNPDPENVLLLRKLEGFAKSVDLDLNVDNLEVIYKRWAKVNKIYSEERLEILESYCTFLNPLMASTPSSDVGAVRALGIFSHQETRKQAKAKDIEEKTVSSVSNASVSKNE